MSKVKKFIVLDVEGMSTEKPYNIGYIVADKHGEIYTKRSIALPSVMWNNLKNCFHAEKMTHRNIEEILTDFENPNFKYKYKTIDRFYNDLLKDIAEYNIKTIWAYNVSFDKNALKRLNEEKFSMLNVEFADIWTAITYTTLMSKKYINWCKKNNKFTPKGYINTKAETVYQYLKGITDFEEEHTGLADTLIEYDILLYAMKSKKKIHKEVCQPWRVIDNFIKGREW